MSGPTGPTVTTPGQPLNDLPTDFGAVNNITPITIGGFGGPHAVFDKNHYKAQTRVEGELIELNAAQGAVTGYVYSWFISLISFNDDLSTTVIRWDSLDASPSLKTWVGTQMEMFINSYQPKRMVLSPDNVTVDPVEPPYPWE